MEHHMALLHRLLSFFYENPDNNYKDITGDTEVLSILIDMKLIEVYSNAYIMNGKYSHSVFIKVTTKGITFIKSFNYLL